MALRNENFVIHVSYESCEFQEVSMTWECSKDVEYRIYMERSWQRELRLCEMICSVD